MPTITIDEIKRKQYGEWFSTEPSDEEVLTAVANREFEERGFQQCRNELAAEWFSHPPEECLRLARQYHARRIAYFVVNGWLDQLELTANGTLRDGAHRLRAAKIRGDTSVNYRVVP
jgi:hypothetical protein